MLENPLKHGRQFVNGTGLGEIIVGPRGKGAGNRGDIGLRGQGHDMCTRTDRQDAANGLRPLEIGKTAIRDNAVEWSFGDGIEKFLPGGNRFQDIPRGRQGSRQGLARLRIGIRDKDRPDHRGSCWGYRT